jgi:uncharacterized protein YfdQ (DUF2303 family)
MTELETVSGDMQAVIDAAQAAAVPSVFDPQVPQGVIVPQGAEFKLPDLHDWREVPTRKTGTAHPATVEALIAYVKQHDEADSTSVWVHPSEGNVVAIIDDHGPEGPQWGEHRASLALAHTPEWLFWTAQDGNMVGQTEFAEHIERGMQEIEDPDAATVLEIAQSFHATSKASFRSATRLTSGEQQFQYDETIAASAGHKGELTVPAMIMLVLAPFVGEPDRKLTARLRYRLNSGSLTLGYVLDRPDVIVRDALADVAERLAATFPHVYVGTPRA